MKSAIPNGGGTFQPLRHRSGTMRDRLHGYTKRTLGAGGSVTEAVSVITMTCVQIWSCMNWCHWKLYM